MKLGIVIPVYGQHNLTRDLMGDLAGEHPADVLVIDNGGDYEPTHGEDVYRPGRNLGWLAGTNAGLEQMPTADMVICLNNDVRLSRGFVAGLAQAAEETPAAGVIAPVYDDVWPQQHCWHRGPAAHYLPKAAEKLASFVDGTCMAITRRALDEIGLLDAEHFGQHGWGADMDYCQRVRTAGMNVVVTHRAYLHHIGRQTAKTIPGWPAGAAEEMQTGMTAKYGAGWKQLLGVEG